MVLSSGSASVKDININNENVCLYMNDAIS